ncbi:MAG: hypothetical protein V1843_00525 [bacterium]
MKKYLFAFLSVALMVCVIAAVAEAKSLKDVEKAMRANPAFKSDISSWDHYEKADLDALKKAAGALGLLDIISFSGDDTKGFMQPVRIAEFKGVINNAKAKKFWQAYIKVWPSSGIYGDPKIVTKGKFAAYYLGGSIPAAAIKALPKTL